MPLTPTQRTTRSGSNSSTVNLNDIKILIENSREDILTSVKVEVEKNGQMFDAIFKRLDDALKQNEVLMNRVKELEDTVKGLEALSHQKSAAVLSEDALREVEERHRRRKFVIVSGLPEPCSGSLDERALHDKKAINALASQIGVDSLEVSNITRIGSSKTKAPRLVRFKCSSVEKKFSLLRASRHLRRHEQYARVFLRPDLTKLQREKDRELRTELEYRRSAGERVVIRSGKIVDPNIYKSYSNSYSYFH